MAPSGVMLNIEKGQWHSLKCLESGRCCWRRRMDRMSLYRRRIYLGKVNAEIYRKNYKYNNIDK